MKLSCVTSSRVGVKKFGTDLDKEEKPNPKNTWTNKSSTVF